jgi:hypothetical protein
MTWRLSKVLSLWLSSVWHFLPIIFVLPANVWDLCLQNSKAVSAFNYSFRPLPGHHELADATLFDSDAEGHCEIFVYIKDWFFVYKGESSVLSACSSLAYSRIDIRAQRLHPCSPRENLNSHQYLKHWKFASRILRSAGRREPHEMFANSGYKFSDRAFTAGLLLSAW